MTALRPERDSSPYGGEAAYGGADAFGAEAFQTSVEGLVDPLTDPLPGARGVPGAQGYGEEWSGRQAYGEPQQQTYEARPQPYEAFGAAPQQADPQRMYEQRPQAAYDAAYVARGQDHPVVDDDVVAYESLSLDEPLPLDDETMSLRADEARRIAGVMGESLSEDAAAASGASASAASASTSAPAPAPGGRAARRKAAKRHGRHGGAGGPGSPQGGHGAHSGSQGARGARRAKGAREGAQGGENADETPLAAAPRSRVEARRAARASKPGMGVIASRVIGEVFITTGVLMLLFVTYQLWWSNIRAQQQAGSATHSLQEDWASGKRKPGAFEPGQGFAILHIPKLDVVSPIAEGISKSKVLDRGMVGHYDENSVKTAMPDAKTGNFGLAGHRNTHGEPFRYINRLKPGDPIVVETQDTYFVYEMASILPVTSPSNTAVLNAIPPGSGFTKAGRYITLTTCTPEFTSKYRMIVWGKMVEERPRSKGKPDALVQ